jgi:hypothetical protein
LSLVDVNEALIMPQMGAIRGMTVRPVLPAHVGAATC